MQHSKDIVDSDPDVRQCMTSMLDLLTKGYTDESRKGVKRKNELKQVDAEYSREIPCESREEKRDSPPAKKAVKVPTPSFPKVESSDLLETNDNEMSCTPPKHDITIAQADQRNVQQNSAATGRSPAKNIAIIELLPQTPSVSKASKALGKGTYYSDAALLNDPTLPALLSLRNKRTLRDCRKTKLISSLEHENVSRLTNVGKYEKRGVIHFIIYDEYMPYDLQIHMTTNSIEHDKIMLYQILRGLKYIHSANIIHNNINPSNLLVNQKSMLKITGFGKAKICESFDGSECRSESYRAPEVLMRSKRCTKSVDIWSVGCIFADIVGKSVIFEARGDELIQRITTVVGSPPSEDLNLLHKKYRPLLREIGKKPPNVKETLKGCSSRFGDDELDLLEKMLTYSSTRISVEEALNHQIVAEGRVLFHFDMCRGRANHTTNPNLEPTYCPSSDSSWEQQLVLNNFNEESIEQFILNTNASLQLYDVKKCVNELISKVCDTIREDEEFSRKRETERNEAKERKRKKLEELMEQTVLHSSSDASHDEVIGVGGFAAVIKYNDSSMGRSLACKTLTDIFSDDLIRVKRTYREIKLLSYFDHHNVVPLVNISIPKNRQDYNEVKIFTELMESDLFKCVRDSFKTRILQPFSFSDIKLIIYQILRGLKYIHSAGIIHRDIKTQNILINVDLTVKICDFGAAGAEIWATTNLSEMMHRVTTPEYEAPELNFGVTKYTNAVDMWSVGCVFIELMGKQTAFPRRDLARLDMILDYFGHPPPEDLSLLPETKRAYVQEKIDKKPNKKEILKTISPLMTDDATDLLAKMLSYESQRISVNDALNHPFLAEGRNRFHSTICTCCETLPNGERRQNPILEPTHPFPFDSSWERKLARGSIADHREAIYQLIVDLHKKLNEKNNLVDHSNAS